MQTIRNISSAYLILLSTMLLVAGLVNCSISNAEKTPVGANLMEKHCSTCHMVPEPVLLNKDTWEQAVLPRMGAYLGMRTSFAELNQSRDLQSAGSAPQSPVLEEADWFTIKNYILNQAPDTLLIQKTYEIVPTLSDFFVKSELQLPNSAPTVSMVKYQQGGFLFYGSTKGQSLKRFDLVSGKMDSLTIGGTPAQLIVNGEELFVLSMGNIHPNDNKEGTLLKISTDPLKITEKILSQLARPVHAKILPTIDDQSKIIVSEFGHITGQLALYTSVMETNKRQILIPLPGAIKSDYQDLNNDGYRDIVALMAQGDEGIFLFAGKEDGSFSTPQPILKFPPSYGSTFFSLLDFNEDGKLDILYVNGDNGDYQPLMKPYHGLRIFLNESTPESLHFVERTFLQVNGAFKALSEDFDLDGDSDIISISYFPDHQSQPQEGLLFFENIGDFKFRAHSLANSASQRWLVMDIGDIDNDGDIDLFLGNSNTMPTKTHQKGIAAREDTGIVIFENLSHP